MSVKKSPVEMEGESVYTGFNVRYFQDVLSATSSEQLVLELGDPLDPALFVFRTEMTACLWSCQCVWID